VFVRELVQAETIPLRAFETGDPRFFEGCLPIEVLAKRGEEALRFGPMRAVGLTDPRTRRWPYAVVQLRQDNLAGSLYNLVGFQTNLRWPEQARVLRLIPGLGRAEFVRYGQMHRNTFLCAPKLVDASLQFRQKAGLFVAGQLAGLEGYMGSAASGLVAGLNAARLTLGTPPVEFPRETMIGSLCWYVSHAEPRTFQPMKANFGLLPPLAREVKAKRLRCQALVARALNALDRTSASHGLLVPP
jgi:methylenetetrahydrofolate--tRNA-(uracil-5-)-methyltransferase